MHQDRVAAIRSLLAQAEQAHGVYEAAELGGVYDREWAQWYAAYALEHGIGPMLERSIGAEELGAFLAAAYAEFEAAEPKPAGDWAEHIARRLVRDL